MTEADRLNLAMEIVRTLGREVTLMDPQRELLDEATAFLRKQLQGSQGGSV